MLEIDKDDAARFCVGWIREWAKSHSVVNSYKVTARVHKYRAQRHLIAVTIHLPHLSYWDKTAFGYGIQYMFLSDIANKYSDYVSIVVNTI